MMILLFIICIIWLFLIIVTNIDSETSKSKSDNYKYKNNKSSVDGIIFPIHIKYKMLERKDLPNSANYDNTYYSYIRNSPSYNCVIDNEDVTTVSMGQEIDLDIPQGEHIIYFESNVMRHKV